MIPFLVSDCLDPGIFIHFYSPIINQLAWQKNTGHVNNSVCNTPKFDQVKIGKHRGRKELLGGSLCSSSLFLVVI